MAWLVVWLLSHSILRLRLEGRERLVPGPAMYCFNHLGWADPLVIIAAFPARARLYFYGPKEETLRQGARNRIMWWASQVCGPDPTTAPFGPDGLPRTLLVGTE